MDRFRLPVVSCGNNHTKEYTKIRKAICAGFFYHAARKDPTEGYKTLVDN
jgi:ATP-dependent RNA helicase DHX8/PRP22